MIDLSWNIIHMTNTSHIFLEVFWIQTNTVNVMGKNIMIWMNHRVLILINLRVNYCALGYCIKIWYRYPPSTPPWLRTYLLFWLKKIWAYPWRIWVLTPKNMGLPLKNFVEIKASPPKNSIFFAPPLEKSSIFNNLPLENSMVPQPR